MLKYFLLREAGRQQRYRAGLDARPERSMGRASQPSIAIEPWHGACSNGHRVRRWLVTLSSLSSRFGPKRTTPIQGLGFLTISPADLLPCFRPNKARSAPLSGSTVSVLAWEGDAMN